MKQEYAKELDFLLRDSIECGFRGFSICYQPQVFSDSGRLYGAEALARWSCGKYGNVPPDVFVPLLEENGMIIELGCWIFQRAVKQCQKWCEYQPDFHMSVNLSGYQFTDRKMLWHVKKASKSLEIPFSNMTLELTESCSVQEIAGMQDEIRNLQESGMQIAMDDFGTGYSSLAALLEIPIDIVKIDKEFVAGINCDALRTNFVSHVTQMCHSMGKKVCLEGVETLEEYETVRGMGAELIQGYYFGKPIEAEEFESLYFKQEYFTCHSLPVYR